MKCGKCNYWLIAPLVLLVAACGGKAKKQADGMTQEKETTVRESSTMETIQVGSVNVTWIQDNAGDRPMARSLFPDAGDALIDSLSLRDGVPSTVSVFVVKTDSVVILFDTGLGAADSRLQAGLKSLGMEPSDVRYLYLTHMHGDHIGGMLTAEGEVVFPNAEVYVSKPEHVYWMSAYSNPRAAKSLEAYRNKLHLFAFGDTLPGNVVALDAAGHTPGHTVYQAGKLLVVGDILHGNALQLLYPEICPTYDMDKEKAIESRKRILDYALKNNLMMAGMHFPSPGFVSLIQ